MRNISKWFLCFRPPATIEIDDGVDCSADRMLSLIAAARSSNRLNKKKKKSLKTKTPDPSVPDHHPPPRTLRRSLSSVVRAVVFEKSLSRSLREARSRSRSNQSDTAPSPSDQKPSENADKEIEVEKSAIAVERKTDPNQIEENNCAPLASDCSFTSIAENTKRSELLINPVVCVVLLSLCVTVFWGRLCAVLMTTVWIYAWQSGAVMVGLGEMMKLMRRRMKKKRSGGVAMEATEIEKEKDRYSAKGKQLIERGLRWN